MAHLKDAIVLPIDKMVIVRRVWIMVWDCRAVQASGAILAGKAVRKDRMESPQEVVKVKGSRAAASLILCKLHSAFQVWDSRVAAMARIVARMATAHRVAMARKAVRVDRAAVPKFNLLHRSHG